MNRIFNWVIIFAVVFTALGWSFSASAATYNAPSLNYPTNNQVLTNYPRVANFSWSSIYGANNYQIEIACDVCVSKTNKWLNAKTYNVVGNTFSVTVPGADNQFRWRVRAVGNMWNNQVGQWSEYRYFTFNTKTQVKLNAPSIYLPSNGGQYNQSSIYFDWSDITGATKYNYEVQKWNTVLNQWESKDSQKIYSAVSAVNYNISNWGDGQFRYRVNAEDNSANKSEWSAWRYFYNTYSTNNNNNNYATSAPVINSPYENQAISADTVTVSWNAINGISQYYIRIWRDEFTAQGAGYQNFVSYQNSFTYTFPQPAYPAGVSKYAVQVCLGFDANCSEVRRFTRNENSSVVAVPSLIAPSNGSNVNSNGVTLDWSNVSDVTSYEYQVTRYIGSEWVSVTSGTATDSSAYVTLTYGAYGQYSFRVRAIRNGSYGNWSNYNQFTYYSGIGYNYSKPVIYTPLNQTYTSQSIEISWAGVQDASGYEINVQYESNSNWYEEGTYFAVNTSYTKYFYNENHYRVRVRAKYGNNELGTWSDWRYFNIGQSDSYYNPQSPPTITEPYANQYYTSNQAVTVRWNSVSNATSYNVRIEYKSGDNWLLESNTNVTSLYLTKYFSYANEYRVQVKANFSDGNYTNWSEYRYFNYNYSGSYYGYSYTAPIISTPTENQTLYSRYVFPTWNTISGAVSYEINVNYKSGNGWYEEGSYTSALTSVGLDLKYTNEYRVRVRAKFPDNTYTSWSDWRMFRVQL